MKSGNKKKRVSNVSRTGGGNRSLKKAFHHYKLAAKLGSHSEAMLKLALCYDYGYAVEVNETKAFEWYLRAGSEGSLAAAKEVALRYEKGIGCTVDREQAMHWKKMAEEYSKF